MILKAIIILGGLAIFGAMIYDRFTGKRMTRKILWPLAASQVATSRRASSSRPVQGFTRSQAVTRCSLTAT